MKIRHYIQSVRSPERGQWVTLPTSEAEIQAVIDKVCVDENDSYKCTDFETDCVIPCENDDIFKQNRALKSLSKLATTEKVIALTEIYPEADIHEISNLIWHNNYEFYPNKIFNDVIEELNLKRDTTPSELVEMGYSQCSTGIIKLKKNRRNLKDKTS